MTHTEIVSFLWDVANLIRDSFKRGKYQDVILPLTVLRRLDCVLAPTKGKVLARNAQLRGSGLEDRRQLLERESGFAFYNTSHYDFDKLLADAPQVAANLRNYIAGFSANMREVVERFDFDNTISKLDEAGLLFQVLERFRKVDLHPDKVDNPTMGTIFEELIRRFNEALDENPGEHFTPRDVVHLMVELMLAGDEERIAGDRGGPHRVRPVLRIGRHADDRQGAHPEGPGGGRESAPAGDQPRGRHPRLRPGGEPRDLGPVEVGFLHEGPARARRQEHLLRKHFVQRPARRPELRLPDRQSALRQGLEARQALRQGGARAWGGGTVRPRAPEDQRRTDALPAAHAGARQALAGGGGAHRDHHERLPALYRRRRERRERDPPVHSGERPAGGAGRTARTALLQHRHRHLRLAAYQPEGPGAGRQGPAH